MRRVPDAYEENVAPGTPRGKKQQTRTQTPATVLHPTQQLSRPPAPATILHPTQQLSQPLAPATILHPTQRVNTPDTELVPTQLAPTQPATPQRDRAARALSFGAATPFVAKNSREGSASTRLSSATPSPTPPAAEDDLAAALSDRLRFASPGEDVTSPASSEEEEESGSWLPRAKPVVAPEQPSPAAEPLLTPPSPPTPSPRPAQRPPSLARRLRTLERSGSGAAVGAPPLAKGRIAKAVADLIRRDEEDAGPTLVLAASGPAADEWIAALTLALGPHCDVLKHATTAAALRRNTPARLARMTCVVATYAQASRADPREARTAPASEWLSSARPVAQVQDSVLHRLTWHRAVYDEAHSLLGTSKRARAAETLDANFSWAVFGPVTLDQLSRKPAQLRALAALVKYPRGAPLARLLLERTVRLDD